MSEVSSHNHKKEYFIVFAGLAILTVLELIVPALKNVTYFFKASSLTLLAVGKAFLVGYFYMHLKSETRWLQFIALIPISAAVYALVVCLESVYR